MTEQELNEWERQDDVLKVLISKEFGAWLYRRDKNRQKKGKWTLQEDKTKKLYGWHICSECGAWIGEPTNYCSNCGADMRGEENGLN